MAHSRKDKKQLLTRINRIKGQLDSASKLIGAEGDCYKVMQVLASCRGALNGLMLDLVDGHIHSHVVTAKTKRAASRAGREVTGILRSFWK